MKYSNYRFTLAIALAVCTLNLTVFAQAQTVTYLADFDGNNGYLPMNSVVQGTDGDFYGTSSAPWQSAVGNVFRVTTAGEITSIYKFCSQPNCADGSNPYALSLGSDGNFYGTAQNGGSYANSIFGSGTIFKVSPGGEFTLLHTFCSDASCSDGQYPRGLLLGRDGNFYGTTESGGANAAGTLFRMSPGGEITEVYSFCSSTACADGGGPFLPPVQATDGNFYGTTAGGGADNGGVIYQLTPSGAYEVLYNFCDPTTPNCPDGSYLPTIAQGADGNLYGTTETGGTYNNGVVFRLTSAGDYTVLHSFLSGQSGFPVPPLMLASDGNLYGTTGGGTSWSWGPATLGSIFQISKSGTYKQLPFFKAGRDGYDPFDSLFQATDGDFYGTTGYGGLSGNTNQLGFTGFGTVFRFSNSLHPLVETVPVGGKPGHSVLVLGNRLTGTTSVTFNGIPANFTVESDTYIKATVPTGATSGAVSVTTPDGTLNSSPQFVVTQ